jgi:hypothetical protein
MAPLRLASRVSHLSAWCGEGEQRHERDVDKERRLDEANGDQERREKSVWASGWRATASIGRPTKP